MNSNLSHMRKEYTKDFLLETNILRNPLRQFNEWMKDAVASGIQEPNAMVVSTASPQGRPSARVVLLKELTDDGFVFFTNYLSHKGREMAENPFAALVFDWHEVERQVRVEGCVQKISTTESDVYFHSRPRSSQIGAWASEQSSTVRDRDALDQRLSDFEKKFPSKIPRPPHWGGFLVRPILIEFWQGRPNRMHDRIVFQRTDDGGWNMKRLAP